MKKQNKSKAKDTKKKTSQNPSAEKSSANKGYTPPSELNLQLVPWAIALVSVFLIFCLFFPSSSGALGRGLGRFLGGLFSYGCYIIPVLLIIRAFKYKKEALSKHPWLNCWLSLAFLCIFACMLNAFVLTEDDQFFNKAILFGENYKAAYENDSLTVNSLVGGFFSRIISIVIGKGFTIVLCLISLFVIAPILVSKTPGDLLRFFAKKLRAASESAKAKREKRKEYFEAKEQEEKEESIVQNPIDKKSRREKIELEEDDISEDEDELLDEAEEDEDSSLENDTSDDSDLDITDTKIDGIEPSGRNRLEQIFGINSADSKSDLTNDDAEEEDMDDKVVQEKQELRAEDTEYIEEYRYPPIELLKRGEGISAAMNQEYETTAKKLVETLSSFGVRTKIINIAKGPTVTRYELQPETGVRVRTIKNLSDDISLSLASKGVRIEAPIPGKEAVGIEVPNKNTSVVNIRELIESKAFEDSKSRLTACLGVDVAGNPVFCDIAKMPHILIAGTTGSGKSVCINSLLVSFLYKSTPEEVKFILIDPKKIELGVYNGIPHLLVPVVSDPKKAAGALAWAVGEMERRFALIEEVGVRDIRAYNEAAKADPERETLPRIVIVIDELADLMMMARDNVEASICRIAQKARAAGMHLVIGTQRPSVDVITGLIKANVPSRIAFTVASQVDSKTILDMAGAEKLVGKGDMLYAPVGAMTPTRVQGSFVSDSEIEEIISFLKDNSTSSAYSDEVIEGIEREAERCVEKGRSKSSDEDMEDDGELSLSSDPMLKPAIEIAIDSGTISTSMLQRRLKLGYARAARIIDKMEAMGVVSEFAGSKPRTVLISREKYLEMITNEE